MNLATFFLTALVAVLVFGLAPANGIWLLPAAFVWAYVAAAVFAFLSIPGVLVGWVLCLGVKPRPVDRV